MQREDMMDPVVDAEEASEAASLMRVNCREATALAKRVRRRRMLAGTVLTIGAMGTAAVMKTWSPCVSKGVPIGHSFISLAETYPQDLLSIGPEGTEDDALLGWLAAASSAGEVAKDSSSASASASSEDQMKIMKEATAAIQTALKGDDPTKAAKVAEEAMIRAVGRNKEKRKQLKEFASRLNISQAAGAGAGIGALGGKPHEKKWLKTKAKVATCVFDVVSVATSVAMLASDINDVSKTCDGVTAQDVIHFNKTDTHANVCTVNAAVMMATFANLATVLATAADDCARTLIPNVDALCSSAVTGFLTATPALAGSFTLISASCRQKGWYYDIPEGLTPSNVGRNKKKQEKEDVADRRLRDGGASSEGADITAPAAPPRKLLFGGGKSSLATQCSTQIMSVAWAMAYVGLSINSMANEDKGASCPAKNIFGGSTFQGPLYKVNQGLCTIDVTTALLNFFTVIAFANLIAVTCTDVLNLDAICGAGISGVFASAAGIAKASTGLWLACDVAQIPILHDVINIARDLDQMTGYKISDIMDNGLGATLDSSITDPDNFGRRLKGMGLSGETLADLKEQYGSPDNVWKSIGYDFSDPTAAWRSALQEAKLAPEDYELLMQKDEAPEPRRGYVGLFEQNDACQG